MRTRLLIAALVLTLLTTPPAHAVSKEMIQLQTQVQALQDALARLQQSNDERMGVLKDLVQQTADSVNKMSVVVNGLQLRIQNEQDATTAKSDQVSGQVQSLNDSVDELKARLQRMEKVLADVQSQQGQTNAALANLPQAGGQPAAAAAQLAGSPASDGSNSAAVPGLVPSAENGAKPIGTPGRSIASPRLPPPAAGPSAGELYRTAYSDYMAGKTSVAAAEFGDLIKAYPDDNLSGNAYFYLGELDARANRPSAAIRDYDHVLEHYPDNNKVPAAHLHKGEALIASKQADAGELELRALIRRFPNSPEANQARSRLNALAAGSRR